MIARELDYHVEVDGAPDAPPLLLLHGFTGSVRSWDALVPQLSQTTRVIRIDLPGHGRTQASADLARHTLLSIAADLVEILRALDAAPARVLGYSMGARLALYLGVQHPACVRALLLESGSPGLATDAERSARIASDDGLAARIERDGIDAFVRGWEALPLWQSQSAALKAAQRPLRLANRSAGLALSLRGMGTGVQPPLWDALASLRMPTRCIVGAHDAKFVAIAHAMRMHNPAIDVTVVKDAGHAVHLEALDDWTRWVRADIGRDARNLR
jgi:2-succinyl-6-hydroxy-2,4-cyclohexadiene-1-carboxylate synthase